MKSVNFNTTKEEDKLIKLSVDRANKLFPEDIDDCLSLQMDLSATHCNGTPLDFNKLLAFNNSNSAHDIFGIMSHIDRNDGQIKHGFLS